MNKVLSICFLIMLPFTAQAVVVISSTTKIKEINSYSNAIDADTLIRVDNPHSDCLGGYFIKMTDLGFEKNLSILLSAFAIQSNIIIRADNETTWPHSPTNKYCRISQIQLFR